MVSTYLTIVAATIVAIVSAAAIRLFWNHLRYRSSLQFIKKTASHRVSSNIELLEYELNACVAREQHNEPMRCFGGPDSSDKIRINEIRGILESHNR